VTNWLEERFSDPDVPDGERTDYRGTIDGKPAGSGTHSISAEERCYRQRLEMEILGEATVAVDIEFKRRSDEILAASYRAETGDGRKTVSIEEGRFDGVRALHFGGRLAPFPRSLTPLLGAALALRGMRFERGAKRSVAIWLAHAVWWEVELAVEKVETISVPAAQARAWRVRARPHFGNIAGPLDRLIGIILPAFVAHFAEDAPHRLLRFEFPTGPFPWDPRGLIERPRSAEAVARRGRIGPARPVEHAQ